MKPQIRTTAALLGAAGTFVAAAVLFERGPGEVTVTPAGEKSVEQAQRLLEEASRIKEIAVAGRDIARLTAGAYERATS